MWKSQVTANECPAQGAARWWQGCAWDQNLWPQDQNSQQDLGMCLSGDAHSAKKNNSSGSRRWRTLWILPSLSTFSLLVAWNQKTILLRHLKPAETIKRTSLDIKRTSWTVVLFITTGHMWTLSMWAGTRQGLVSHCGKEVKYCLSQPLDTKE